MADAKDFFENYLPGKMAKDRTGALSIGAVFLFTIEGDGGGKWTVDFKEGVVAPGDRGDSECTIECALEDWTKIQDSPPAAMQLYFEGKLKIGGNVMLATKLQQILS